MNVDLTYGKKLTSCLLRVRTLTGKEIELDIEPDYKVRSSTDHPTVFGYVT